MDIYPILMLWFRTPDETQLGEVRKERNIELAASEESEESAAIERSEEGEF